MPLWGFIVIYFLRYSEFVLIRNGFLYLNSLKTTHWRWLKIYMYMYIYILYISTMYAYINIYVYTYIYKLWKPRYYEAYFVFIILCFVVDVIIIIILHTTCSALTNVRLANVIKVVNLYEYISTMSMVS